MEIRLFSDKIAVRAGVGLRLVTSYLSILHGISSGPSAFLGLIPFRSLPPVRLAPG